MLDKAKFDFIVVGAGNAGCVLAERLSASGRFSVLLIEAGGEDHYEWMCRPADQHADLPQSEVTWQFKSEPDARTAGREITQRCARVIGGASSINGAQYLRGQREDYDAWHALGNAGWGYSEVLPWFRKAEHNPRWTNEYHGTAGPLCVSDPETTHPLCEAFIAAAAACGYPRNPDFNGATQAGFGYSQVMLRKGSRCSTAVGYLRPARTRSNLAVLIEAQATRILLDGNRAIGVDYRHDGGRHSVYARGEVIVAAGALNSPRLLQLSGLGPASHLQSAGIAVKADMAGVGANLLDHYCVRLGFKCHEAVTSDDNRNPFRSLIERLRRAMGKGFPPATGFVATEPGASRPDVQIDLVPDGGGKDDPQPFAGFALVVTLLRPESRGTVLVKSPNPCEDPAIRPNYLDSSRDCEVLVAGMKIARRMAEAGPLRRYITSAHESHLALATDDAWLQYLRERGSSSGHPAGTCRMGSDAGAVVDERLRVRGIERLRVVDASIMPLAVSGDTSVPAVMIGEKGANMILQDAASIDVIGADRRSAA